MRFAGKSALAATALFAPIAYAQPAQPATPADGPLGVGHVQSTQYDSPLALHPRQARHVADSWDVLSIQATVPVDSSRITTVRPGRYVVDRKVDGYNLNISTTIDGDKCFRVSKITKPGEVTPYLDTTMVAEGGHFTFTARTRDGVNPTVSAAAYDYDRGLGWLGSRPITLSQQSEPFLSGINDVQQDVIRDCKYVIAGQTPPDSGRLELPYGAFFWANGGFTGLLRPEVRLLNTIRGNQHLVAPVAPATPSLELRSPGHPASPRAPVQLLPPEFRPR